MVADDTWAFTLLIIYSLMPTSQGAPQVHPVKNSSHIPPGETHTGLVGTDGRPLSHEQGDLNSRDHDQQQQHVSSGGLAGQGGEQYTARDEGLEPYSAPPQAEATSGNHPTSGYLPDKKIGPATGAAEETGHTQHQNTSTGLGATSGDNTNDNSNNRQSILADPSHPDNILVEELERRAQKSGTHAVGFGTHGDEEPPSAQEGGYTNDLSHLNNTDNDKSGKYGGLAAGGLGAGGLGTAAYNRGGNSYDNEGDHTDTEAPDMQPSQSYIQRQSVYSQPPSTRAGDNAGGEPLAHQKTDQSYEQGAPFSSRDYGSGHAAGGQLVPAGGGVMHPVAGVLPRDAESGALARNYEPSSYTQAGMAGVGAGTAAGGIGAAALSRSAGASAVGTGHPDTAEYIQQPQYDQQQQPQYEQDQQRDLPQAQRMEAYPSHQTQQTQRTGQSYGTAQQQQQQQPQELDNQQQHHQQTRNFAAVPAPMPIFQDHHNQESQLHEDLPVQQDQLPQQQHQQQQMNGPTTAVPALATANGIGAGAQSLRNSVAYPQSPASTTAAYPIHGGGLGAAIATSGHDLTKDDKKSLKKEIKSERKFEKSLKEEAKKEGQEIEIAMKMAKLSLKKADKSGRYEANFRSTYEKAIKKEVAAKQRLLRVTNEYNKVAADLERVTKEMEIRRNAHIADVQTRDADSNKVDELRRLKGQHDMEREARHGDSLTKQKQAKRALSMSSKRKSSLF